MRSSVTLELKGPGIHVGGVRAFFWKLASEFRLAGWAANSSEGILLRLEGSDEQLSSFIRSIPSSVPAAFQLRHVCVLQREPAVPDEKCLPNFSILDPPENTPEVRPDLKACDDCVKEAFDPASRRFCYPFFSCAGCGPAYSLSVRSPFTRRNTSLTAFPMCRDCQTEKDHGDPRHQNSELLACPLCGPQFFLLDMYGDLITDSNPLCQAREALSHGEILAVQSLYGGFQLFTDALNPDTIQRLRRKRKLPNRPLCVIIRTLETVRKFCVCSEEEARLLSSPEAPFLLLRKKPDCSLPELISPDTDTLAVGLPSSLQEKLLFEHQGDPGLPPPFEVLVTCGDNRPGKAECQDIDDVFNRLMAYTDKFLCHDLKTGHTCQSSICEIYQGRTFFHRRARGYVPKSIVIKNSLPRIVGAFGCDSRAAVALGVRDRIIPSQAFGSLDGGNETAVLADMLERFTCLFDQVPELMVCDMDRDSFSARACTDFADLHDLPLITVQTHHAHALACMAEHSLKHALALVMNGGSPGPDGSIWGAECLEARMDGFSRLASFRPLPLTRGRPARLFLAYLIAAHADPSDELLSRIGADRAEYELWRNQPGLHPMPNCSPFLLANAVCAGLGIISDFCSYPERALLLLRKYAGRFTAGTRIPDNISIEFQFKYSEENGFRQIDWTDTMLNLARIRTVSESDKILFAEAFYNALAESMLAMSLFAESRTGLRDIVLSGSMFLDPILCAKTRARLESRSFKVFTHVNLAGDESCVPVGQVYAAGETAEN